MQTENTWLNIPFEDYENHMSHENVGQLQALNKILKSKLDYLRPISLAVPGCATGNGFEHVNSKVTKLVYGIDINQKYLDVARERYGNSIDNLNLICADLNSDDVDITQMDLIFAGLIFEYLDLKVALPKTYKMLGCDGLLVVILQNSLNGGFVSDTAYSTLENLNTYSKQIDEFDFGGLAAKNGFIKTNRETYKLNEQKEFVILTFRKGMI
jgi:SAM-dependent methyltransferase